MVHVAIFIRNCYAYQLPVDVFRQCFALSISQPVLAANN